ncbi:MAG: aminopeptidase, partial [Sphaerochaetaceae bacterium]|nr:aminopeptidase [Sphaerochaetaceae bacterium]
WSLIRIDNTDERNVLLDAPAQRLGAFSKATSAFHKELKAAAMNNELTWCVVCVPSLRWAQSVLGESKSEEDMWQFIAPILHLDQDDPLSAMKKNFERTEKRAEKITALKLRRLHFTSSVTDLTVSLRENHIFTGGGDILANGSKFYPNIPSEEVFTTPDYLLTEGYVRTTRPISVMDSRVENAFFRFEAGVVVESHAEIGDEILQQYLDIDEGARHLGEIALVDQSSPIAQADVVFNSILYDENASCHFALGAGYPTCLELDDPQADEQELLRNGCNVSQVHTDFMFGSDDMNLAGYDAEGKEYLIMKEGSFTPDFA